MGDPELPGTVLRLPMVYGPNDGHRLFHQSHVKRLLDGRPVVFLDEAYARWHGPSRIRRELGYAEQVPRDEALRRTVAWERENPPEQIDVAKFDYAAEDALFAEVGAR